jgi:hypothetical protein
MIQLEKLSNKQLIKALREMRDLIDQTRRGRLEDLGYAEEKRWESENYGLPQLQTELASWPYRWQSYRRMRYQMSNLDSRLESLIRSLEKCDRTRRKQGK